MKTKKKASETRRKAARPKDVWNSVRKLEGFLKKADIQAGVFMESLRELRDAVTLEVKAGIVKGLCNSVNGNILHALSEHRRKVEEGRDSGDIERNAVMLGVYDTLNTVLALDPVGMPGETMRATRATAKLFDFEEYPEDLDVDGKGSTEVVVLRAGWKVGETIVVKPKVFHRPEEREMSVAAAVRDKEESA